MKNKKMILISCAALALVICVSAIAFVAEISKGDLPDCAYKITKEQREMSTYDLLKWFCETEYMAELTDELSGILYSSQIQDKPFLPCEDHQAYYELIKRDDLHDAYWQLKEEGDYTKQLFLLTYPAEFGDIVGAEG